MSNVESNVLEQKYSIFSCQMEMVGDLVNKDNNRTCSPVCSHAVSYFQ